LNGVLAATVPVSQSFESFTNNHPIVNEADWSGSTGAGLISTNAAVIAALDVYITGDGVLPLPSSTHTNVLAISDALVNTVGSSTGGVVTTEWLLLPSHRDAPPTGNDNHQLAFYVSTNSELVVWHRDTSGTPTNQWLTLSGNPDINSNDWVRITIVQDYATDRYQISVNGTAYTNALGETRAGANPGSWFHMVQTNGYMSRLRTSGEITAYIDDLVFTNRSLTYSGTSFAEVAANDGRIATTNTITLSGDTFVDTTYSAGTHFSTSGVPAGLTMTLAYVSPTQVRVTLTGSATAHTASDGVGDMGLTLEDDIFTLGAAASVTGYTRSDLSVSFDDPPVLSYDTTTFMEAFANDGSIGNTVTVTLADDTFVDEAFVENTHFEVSGIPAGLYVSVVRDDATTLTISLTNNATAHADANDTDLTLTFVDAVFDTVATANITDSTKTLSVNFVDTVAMTYSTTTYSETAANNGAISGGTIALVGESFTGPVGTNYVLGGEVDVSNLPDGLEVAITKANDYQVTVSFSETADDHADADGISDLTFAFQNAAFTHDNAAAVGNSTRSDLVVDFDDPPVVAYSGTTFSEVAANNGTFTNTLTLTLTGDTFVNDGAFNEGDEYAVANEPSGLTLAVTRDSATQLTVSLTGTAAAHTSADDVADLTLTLQDAAFTTVAAANITDASRSDLVVAFTDAIINSVPYVESFEDYDDGYAIGADEGWHPASSGVVTNETAIVNALTASFSSFPITTNHTKVLRLTDQVADEIRSESGGTLYTDALLYVTPREDQPADNTDYQFAMYVDTNQVVNVWHRDTSGTATNTWTTLSGVTLTTNAWHRVTVEKDYAASKYRLYLDRSPTPVNNPTSDDNWFNMVGTANAYMSRVRILGALPDQPVYIDDLVVGTQPPDYFTPGGSIFRFR